MELIHLHRSLYSRDVQVKQSFVICNTFQAVYEDSVIIQHMLQSFALQNSSLNFKSTKHKNVTHFISIKRVKGQYFCKTSFWLHKLVIQTHFKNKIQYGTCYMWYWFNFNKTLPYLMANETILFGTFLFYLILKSVFEVFIADLYLVLPS